ncbi:MAG: phosphomannomutase/phosphoglucomutase, partial [Clostridia bacterium]|nr:phosphomannomutase/phosphoglucomutase [Clostridia bacterium]
MTRQDFLRLKNGTDVRGTAIEAENDPVTLTDEAVTNIAMAFCIWLTMKKRIGMPRIAIGHDSRLSAKRIEKALVRGITDCGRDVILTGLSSTPSMFMLLQDDFGADASVMITASHLPYRKNGLKFFVKEGGLEGEDITEILQIAAAGNFPRGNGTVTRKSYLEKYALDLVKKVRTACGKQQPLQGKRILVDAGNGAGGFYADLVLKPLGADTAGSQFLEPDGSFPNHIPNPENAEAMKSVCDAVKRHKADFGIIFDTDVDRAGAVSADGEEINRNRLIALISAILLQERHGAYIVTDSVTSDGLTQFITGRGGVHHRYKRGYKNVINESIRLNAEGKYCPLAIETSGHAAFRENYFLDDGAYLVTRILIALAKCAEEGKELTDLISSLPEAEETQEIRLPFAAGVDFKTLGAQVIEELKEYANGSPSLSLVPDNYEGVRVNFAEGEGDGWVLVRMSLHEPIMPINIESNVKGGNAIMIQKLYGFLKQYLSLIQNRRCRRI